MPVLVPLSAIFKISKLRISKLIVSNSIKKLYNAAAAEIFTFNLNSIPPAKNKLLP